LNKRLPDLPTPFDSTDRYATASTQESAFLDELYRHFPQLLHKVMESSYFSDLVMKSIPDARANEIKKLRGVAGDIFNLPSKYFTNTSYDRANILKALLCGITSLHHTSSGGGAHTNSMKWSIRQVTPGCIAWAAVLAIFLLSPDTEFSSTGIGKRSTISYKDLFFTYKKVLVTKWKTKHIVQIVTNINHYIFKAARPSALDSAVHEDFTNTIDRALAALDMESSD
ncbi:hypothetical protein EV424DRAFT_1278444, partial [Suillus variegatus]